MSIFQRGIKNPNFIAALKNNHYFKKMLSDKDLFIAIRNEYINVYHFGQSICKITFNKKEKKLKWKTHKKYIGRENESGYDETPEYYLNNITKLKSNSKDNAGEEKTQIKKQILNNRDLCILDVEVGFGKESAYIDYVAIDKTDDNRIKLVFYEAKHFDNSDIRAKENPKVFGQMEKYDYTLNKYKSDIIDSYKNVYENILTLNLSNKNKLIEMIGHTFDNVEIDIISRLIIFEVDENRKGRFNHIEKLKQKFSNRLILIDLNKKRI